MLNNVTIWFIASKRQLHSSLHVQKHLHTLLHMSHQLCIGWLGFAVSVNGLTTLFCFQILLHFAAYVFTPKASFVFDQYRMTLVF